AVPRRGPADSWHGQRQELSPTVPRMGRVDTRGTVASSTWNSHGCSPIGPQPGMHSVQAVNGAPSSASGADGGRRLRRWWVDDALRTSCRRAACKPSRTPSDLHLRAGPTVDRLETTVL